MTTRRGFISSILSCATPPGFVRSGVLMPLLVPRRLTPVLTPLRNQVFVPHGPDIESMAREAFAIHIAAAEDKIILSMFGGGGGGGTG